jgi:hypothetical protein
MDGKIFAANLASPASTVPFKVYMWDSVTSAPVVVIDYTSPNADRLGDKFTVIGNYATNNAILYAASATAGQARIYKWTMSGGSFNPTPQIITLSDNLTGGSASVGPMWEGSFYFNSTGQSAKKYDAAGTLLGTIPGGIVATGSNAIRFIGTVDTMEYVATFQFGAGNNNARVIGVPVNNPAGAVTFGITPSMGSAANANGAGDVAVRLNSDGTANIYVLATNNGIGVYRTNYVVPVELNSFAADVNDRSVELKWSTATESNSFLFQVERTSLEDQEWKTVADIRAAGSTTEMKNYSYTDKNLNSGKYLYRLKMVDLDGTYNYSASVEAEIGIPMEFSISQNYPNPFNPTTKINYQIPADASVTIEMFDITGQKVATLVQQDMKAGYHTLEVSGLRLSSGMYIYRMHAVSSETGRNFMDVKKMMLLK